MPKQSQVPDLVTSGLETVAVRCPQHPVAQQLLAAVQQPLAAPSANRFGRISPTSAEHVMAELGNRIEYILDGGTCDVGIESTVLAIGADDRLTLLRPGGVSLERVAGLVASEIHRPVRQVSSTTSQPAPGLLAPHKSLQLFERPWSSLFPGERQKWLESLPAQAGVGVMLVAGDPEQTAAEMRALARSGPFASRSFLVRSLSSTGDNSEAARKLFGTLRMLDEAAEVDLLWAERVPDSTGLGFAINDRLHRASRK
jgi:L-threonylcarbamoyladenylate synthase